MMKEQKLIDAVLDKWVSTIPNGVIDLNSITHQANLIEILRDMNIEEDKIQEVMSSIRGEVYEKQEVEELSELNDQKQVKKLSERTSKNNLLLVDGIASLVESSDSNTIARCEILQKSWKAFMSAKTYDEQVSAIREMADNNLIENNLGGTKIYLTSNTTLPYKYLTGQSGTSVTKVMNDIIKTEGLDVPLRKSSSDHALADVSGKHNEAGVVSYLDPSKDNIDIYEEIKTKFLELGGDERKFDQLNKKAAELIKSNLPKESKITSAVQVGGIGLKALAELRIDPKVDPTDLIINYIKEDGSKDVMKITAKIYTNPKSITMKNSGVTDAGVTYLGESGKLIDEQYPKIRDKYRWDNTTSDLEKQKMKKELKEEYLKLFYGKMSELTESEEGQNQLIKMWKDVHGSDKNVYTQIINKRTGDIQIRLPEYYDPKPKFKVHFNGIKLIIEMEGEDTESLNIVLKTEDKGPVKLLFNHVSRG